MVHVPGGKWVFSRIIGWFVPYSGTIKANVVELRPGAAKLILRDRRRVRNHLDSIHAIALMNLGELASGLAFNMGLPENSKAIVTGLSIEFLKKARGTLTASSLCPVLSPGQKGLFDIESEIRNSSNAVVAKVQAKWRVSSTFKCH